MSPNLKVVDRSSTVAFSHHAGLLAAGTVAGAIDMTFSTKSELEVFALDFASTGDALPLVGKVQAPERFNRLAWGCKLQDGSHSLGLLAGGLSDGSLVLWDPAIIVDKNARTENRTPLLAKMNKHSGPVKGLEFNTFSPNLLASGATDGDLCIWDLAKPTTPSLYPALKGPAGAGAAGEVTFISWNRKVQHILASSSTNGSTVVWDLKRQKPVISFRDPNSQRRASVLQWNPEVATQLVVASDDDRSPTLQLWDLRNSQQPLKEFVGHTKGVLGMAWSPHDPTLLLSCAKDNRTICWDMTTADLLCELPASNNWNFDVQWCPNIPGVFSTSSFDGHVGICNLHACTMSSETTSSVNADFSVTTHSVGKTVPLKRAPAWMKRPASVSVGFGGRLVTLANQKSSITDASGAAHVQDKGVVQLGQVVTEHELIQRSEAFEQAIAGGDKQTLQAYCKQKAESLQGEESETWSFLGLLYETDGRRELLRKLGFADLVKEEPVHVDANGNGDVAPAGGPPGAPGERTSADGPGRTASQGGQPEDFFGQQDDPDFFDKLPDEAAPSPRASATGAAAASTRPPADGDAARGPGGDAHAVPEGSTENEEEIQRALMAGNYEAAVESCFRANRLADALLIANIFNSDLYKRTMQRYMKRCPKPFMQIVRANVEQDWETLVRTRPVGQWRETLALLVTYTSQDEWPQLCDVLAARLSQAGMHHAASLCYICAGNVDAVVAYWSKAAQQQQAAAARASAGGAGGDPAVQALQAVMEKAVLFGHATGNKKASSSLSDLVTKYASILAAQGRMYTAFEYLDYVPGEASTTVAVLKDRIFRSGKGGIPHNTQVPPFPFIMVDVRPCLDQGSMGGAPLQSSTSAAAGGAWGGGAYGHPAPSSTSRAAQPGYPQAAQPSAYGAAPYSQPTTGGGAVWGAHAPAEQPQHYAAATPPAYGGMAGVGMGAAGGMWGAAQPQQPQQQEVYKPSKPQPLPYIPPAGQAPAAAPPPQANMWQQAATHQAAPPIAPPPSTVPTKVAPSFSPVVTAPSDMPKAPVTGPYGAAGHAPAGGMQPPMGGMGMGMGGAMPGPMPMAGGPPMGGMAAPVAPQAPQPKPQPPPPPPGPPANITITTVDTSKVPPQQQPIVKSLMALFNSCAPLANNPGKKKEMEDTSRKIGQLLWRLAAGEVSEGVIPKLLQLCQAVDASDWQAANHMTLQMTTTDWDDCGPWLPAVKRLIKLRQQGG